MKTLQNVKNLFLVAVVVLAVYSCNKDDDFTPRSEVYQLESANGFNISGTATFTERQNGTTTIELQLTGTPAGGNHPAHIHNGVVGDAGTIAVSLSNVDGDTGMSTTEVSQLDDLTAVGYDDLVEYAGYINVHLSGIDLTVVSNGNIGSSAGQ